MTVILPAFSLHARCLTTNPPHLHVTKTEELTDASNSISLLSFGFQSCYSNEKAAAKFNQSHRTFTNKKNTGYTSVGLVYFEQVLTDINGRFYTSDA